MADKKENDDFIEYPEDELPLGKIQIKSLDKNKKNRY